MFICLASSVNISIVDTYSGWKINFWLHSSHRSSRASQLRRLKNRIRVSFPITFAYRSIFSLSKPIELAGKESGDCASGALSGNTLLLQVLAEKLTELCMMNL